MSRSVGDVDNLVCPYCDHAAAFENNLHEGSPYGQFGDADESLRVGLSSCPSCRCVVAIGYHNSVTGFWDPVATLPQRVVSAPDPLIPGPVADDLFEARKCFAAGTWKATAAMCRRALQGACLDLGATPGKVLQQQVAEVVASNRVHASLEEWARAIRVMGNSGAHPGDDGLETVTQEEAQDILSFTEQFLELTFVVAAKVRARVAAHQASAKPVGS
jgi:Domain of unknown function (DUF4145)